MKPAILLLLVLPLAVRADDLQSDLLDSLDRAAKRLAESPGNVDGYQPENPANILDPKTDAVALLKGLPSPNTTHLLTILCFADFASR